MYNPYMYEDEERLRFPRVGEIILYTVNKGDNVYRLAQTFNSEVAWIQAMNRLNEDNLLQINQQLLIPMMFRKSQQSQMNQRQTYDLYF